MRAIIVFMLAAAVASAAYGVWLIASEDVQGGRDSAGSAWLAGAGGLLICGLALYALKRRSDADSDHAKGERRESSAPVF